MDGAGTICRHSIYYFINGELRYSLLGYFYGLKDIIHISTIFSNYFVINDLPQVPKIIENPRFSRPIKYFNRAASVAKLFILSRCVLDRYPVGISIEVTFFLQYMTILLPIMHHGTLFDSYFYPIYESA